LFDIVDYETLDQKTSIIAALRRNINFIVAEMENLNYNNLPGFWNIIHLLNDLVWQTLFYFIIITKYTYVLIFQEANQSAECRNPELFFKLKKITVSQVIS
jgi:hypothetical protein